MANLRCCKCGCYEHAELIDCKDDGRGDYTVEQCIACYGPGYAPLSDASIAKSIRPELAPLYATWLTKEKRRRARAEAMLDMIRAVGLSNPSLQLA